MRDIVVGVDRSATARAAARRAAELAAALDVDLHIVTAVQDAELTNIQVGDGHIEWSWKGAGDIAELIEELPYDRVTHVAVSSDPATALCEEAERIGAQAIVVGNKRVQGVSRALGSVAGAVLRRAPCDVFVVSTAG
jgi:nucleotide-binding universal stress UspA family protein